MILDIAQLTVAIALIVLILLQERSSGFSSLFGGGGGDASYQTRRGLEKTIFAATIVCAVLFVALTLLSLIR